MRAAPYLIPLQMGTLAHPPGIAGGLCPRERFRFYMAVEALMMERDHARIVLDQQFSLILPDGPDDDARVCGWAYMR